MTDHRMNRTREVPVNVNHSLHHEPGLFESVSVSISFWNEAAISPDARTWHMNVWTCKCCSSLLYSAILRSRADSLRSHVILHEWIAFYSAFSTVHRDGVLTGLAWLVPHETAAVSAQVLCTPYNHAPCYFMQSHIRKVHAPCLL